METILYISIFINIALGYIIYNLVSKQERLEKIIDNNDTFMSIVSSMISEANDKLDSIKSEGMMGYDENVEWFYQYIKELQKTFGHITQSPVNYDPERGNQKET